jgi:hypothetical protein
VVIAGEEHRVAVRRRAGSEFGRDVAAGARLALDDELLASTSVIFKATKRAIVSAPPPGVNGMRMRTGLFGHALCPIAGHAMLGTSAADADSLMSRRRLIMFPSRW